MFTKIELRSQLLALREKLDSSKKKTYDHLVADQVMSWWEEKKPPSIGVYWPMRDEPDLHSAYAILHAKGVQLALPVVVARDCALKFVPWSPGEPMQSEKFGAKIPAAMRDAVFPTALIIPCVGFNRQCFRLGYGGGFYDRTVARVPRPEMVGVAYQCGACDFSPERFDVPLDRLITEQNVLYHE